MNKKLAFAVLAALATSSAHAESWFQAEASLGGLKYGGLNDGRWIQEGNPHSTSLYAPAIEAGIGGTLLDRGSWGVDWHVGGFYLGRAESQCACTPMDQDYDVHRHKQIRHEVPNADFVGSGDVYGAKATLEPWYNIGHGFHLGLIAGVTYSRVRWTETVYGWSQPGIAPRTISNDSSGTVPGGVVGASVTSGRVSLVYQHFFFAHPGNAQALFRSADTISLRYRF